MTDRYKSPGVLAAEQRAREGGHKLGFLDNETGEMYRWDPESQELVGTGRYKRQDAGGDRVLGGQATRNLEETDSLHDDLLGWNPDVEVYQEDLSDPRLFDLGARKQDARASEASRLAQREALARLMEGADSSLSVADMAGLAGAQDRAAMSSRNRLQSAGGGLGREVEAVSGMGSSPYEQANRAATQRAYQALSGYGGAATNMRNQSFNSDFYRRNAVDDYNTRNIQFMRDATNRNVDRVNRSRETGAGNRRWRNHMDDAITGTKSDLVNQGARRAQASSDRDAATRDTVIGGVEDIVGIVASTAAGA